jgi:hypothetical protein
MKSIKDIKRQKGYIEFKLSNTVTFKIPFTSIKKMRNGYRIESKQNSIIDTLFKSSNFNNSKNFILSGNLIEYIIVETPKYGNKIVTISTNPNYGLVVDLLSLNDCYIFTLTK